MRAVPSNIVLACLALALMALILCAGLPARPRYLGVLNNAGHAPVFGAFAIIAFTISRRLANPPAPVVYLSAFTIAVVAGALVELIQPAIGRDREIADIGIAALGAGGGLALLALRDSRLRLASLAVLVIASLPVAWPVFEVANAYRERGRQSPSVLEISSRHDWYFLQTGGLDASAALLPERWRRPGDPESLRLQFKAGRWRVIAHDEPIPDWRPFTRLVLDVTNPGPEPLRLTLRVHDRSHDNQAIDRFNHQFALAAESRSVLSFPLSEIAAAPAGRRMDLSQVAGLMIFAGTSPELTGREFYVTRIRLE